MPRLVAEERQNRGQHWGKVQHVGPGWSLQSPTSPQRTRVERTSPPVSIIFNLNASPVAGKIYPGVSQPTGGRVTTIKLKRFASSRCTLIERARM